jgi:hypothetical protein
MRTLRSMPSFVAFALLGTFTLCAATAAQADLTLKAKISGTGMGAIANGETVTYVKGHRMRSEMRNGKEVLITLMDIDKGSYILIDGSKGDAFDVSKAMSQQRVIDEATLGMDFKALGTQGSVAGATCENYQMRINVAVNPADPAMGEVMVVMEGPACLVKDAPGLADYAAFYQHAAETGFFLGDPRAAQSQPGRERGMTLMYKKMASLGMPYSMDLKVGFQGDGFMAKMMGKMAFTTQTQVTAVSTETLPDSLFEVPAGTKIKKH